MEDTSATLSYEHGAARSRRLCSALVTQHG
jgi:hypothetical protein